MRRKTIVWTIVGAALCGCSMLAGMAIYTKRIPPEPPFERSDSYECWTVYNYYEEDEDGADKQFKGKVLRLYNSYRSDTRTDEEGEKYISAYRRVDLTKHPIPEEVIRCYLHRPENPVMKDNSFPSIGVQDYAIEGVCLGKIDGIIVMRKCYLVGISVEGADW